MSFSKDVKEEIAKQISNARHCRLAEIAALLSACGHVIQKDGEIKSIVLQTENIIVARKYFTLLKKTFNINTEILIRKNKAGKNSLLFLLVVKLPKQVSLLYQATKLSLHQEIGDKALVVDPIVVQNTCCKRAFVRGLFLAAGSMSDPEKTYHYEIVFPDSLRANQLQEIINSFLIEAKIVLRKKYYVVYVKEGSQIVDLLNIMEAHTSLMDFENVRILKEMRNSINRQVNCEAANINKTVTAAAKQIDDILFIRDTIGFDNLTEGLEEIAELRISYPESSLKELGAMLNPPIGKSGVNHRLKKLCSIADGLRQ
ncbi:MAG TPA: DNA-binding protein WhiA [Lachnoclostridium phytofermentans]|uniref:Probable cell division protein WhiA n=1 Tax=Lachnoclostridium phytofermentans TaxID=66219 RepID=A0A3D2X216_9FIRM|nr:DNA-binding protein WhiA [Lachnoclostridium sp.]HCL01026.1 DNA-binding protein WhiA [Lachnoclostridium phytofermentans]